MLDVTKTAESATAPVAPYKVDAFKGGHNDEVSTQWMSRPADQRFLSLNDLFDYKKKFFDGSFESRSNTREIEILSPDLSTPDAIHKLTVGLKVDNGRTVDAREVAPTNHAFGQLAGLAKAPAGFMRELPSPIVADTLNYRLRFAREVEAIKFYGGAEQLYAATGPDYGRIPDFEIVKAVQAVAGTGRGEARWKVPGVLNWSTMMYDPEAPVTLDSTTLYASDRDIFMFLVDDRNPIEVGKLPSGEPDLMFRGFYCQNSEVGTRSAKIAAFYLRAVCMNRNLWGVENFEEIRIIHNRTAADRWIRQAVPALTAYANASEGKLIAGVKAAKEAVLASNDEEALDFLRKRQFSGTRAKSILEQGLKEEQRPVRTAWDFAQAITANARTLINNDDRLQQELAAKAVLDAVA